MAGAYSNVRNELGPQWVFDPNYDPNSKNWHFLVEKQLAAIYAALQAIEAVTGMAKIQVRTTYPMQGWLCTWI